MRVLFAEGKVSLPSHLSRILQSSGTVLDYTASLDEVVPLAARYDYDTLILNVEPPHSHGFSILRKLRDRGIGIPVIVLSSSLTPRERVECFALGADDIVTKPFDGTEIMARACAIVRRSSGQVRSRFNVGCLEIDIAGKQVIAAGKRVHLTAKEYSILELLALRRGCTITADMFLSHLYNTPEEPGARIIDVFICNLRRKLMQAGVYDLIETVRGHGYVIRRATLAQTVTGTPKRTHESTS